MSARDEMARPPDCGYDSAPYVLGALEPDEARAFVGHMERCAVCRDEVATLAPVLDSVTASAAAHPVPRGLRRRVLRAARAEPRVAPAEPRRRIRPVRYLAPAGWLALGATMVAAAVVAQVSTPGPREHALPARVGQAQLRVDAGHGELIVERLPSLPSSQTYELWVERGGHRPVPSTLFGVTSRGTADLGVPGDLHGVTRLLVTVEPRGGSPHPTTRAVIQLPLTYVSRS